MSDMLSKYSAIQKEAILGRLEVMKDAEMFDKSFNKEFNGNPLVKEAVNRVALQKFAELIAENNVNKAKEQTKFANAKRVVDESMLKKIGEKLATSADMLKKAELAGLENQLRELLVKKAAMPSMSTIKSQAGEKLRRLLSTGADEDVVRKLREALGDDAAAILGRHAGIKGDTAKQIKKLVSDSKIDKDIKARLNTLVGGASEANPNDVSKLFYDRLSNRLKESFGPNSGQLSKKTKEIVSPINPEYLEAVARGIPGGLDTTTGEIAGGKLTPAQLSDLLNKKLFTNEDIQKTIANTRKANAILGALGLTGAGTVGYLGAKTIPDYIESTRSKASVFPSKGYARDYILGALTGAGSGLGLNYLAQGLGTGDWNPASMDPSKALLAAGTGAATGALTSPLLPSYFNSKK